MRRRVIVDRQTHFRRVPEAKPQLIRADRIPKHQITQSTSDQALLAPPSVIGMNLETDHWDLLWIDHLNDIERAANSWDELILDSVRKKKIRTLVEYHDYSQRDSATKGSGLVLFLSGLPGTGKTLTIGQYC